ncbi:MAG TPA: hypothetical protein VGB04_07555 [Allosphingosinicella sp.]|jgi:hypothetical protein
MSLSAELVHSTPPWLAELGSRAPQPSATVAAPFQPGHAIGLVAAPPVLAQTLDYVSGYFEPTLAPPVHILEVAPAGAEVGAWADDARCAATPIGGSRLSMASGLSGDVSWHLRFEEAAFADLTVFLPGRTVVVTPDDGVVPPQLALARLVRNRLSSDWSLSGAAYLHAGCVAIGGRGVVILGDKFSGKTTQICELVSRGASFTSNDRIFLFEGGRVLGLPVSVNIRPATLARYDSLAGWRGLKAPNPHRVGMNVPDSDVSLSVGRFTGAFGATISPAIPLHAIVKLVRHDGASTEARALEAREAVDLLASSLFDGIDYSQPFWDYRRALPAMIAALVERHSSMAFEIRVGEGGIGECARLIEDFVMGGPRLGSHPSGAGNAP